MPCRKCDDLRAKYGLALARLRNSLTEFEKLENPTLLDVDRLEQDRAAVDEAVRQLRDHLAEHGE